jgi:hypothetical protein
MPSRTLPPGLRPAPEPPAPPAPPALLRAAEAVTSADLPGLRLVIVPDTAPPYDCEAHGTACPAQRDPAGAEPVSPRGAGWAPEPVSARTAAWPAAPGTGSASAASSAAAAAPAWPRQFAQVVVEILAGARSPRQIVPCTTDRVRAQIALLTPLVAADRPPRIQRIVMSHPAAHAVEMTVVVSFGPRARALAIRCEHLPPRPAAPGRPGRPARWLCTELEAG